LPDFHVHDPSIIPRDCSLSRRVVLRGASAAGLGTCATPGLTRSGARPPATPATTSQGWTRSITRDDYLADLRQHVPLEAPRTRGRHVLTAFPNDPASLNPMLVNDYASGEVLSTVFNALATRTAMDGTWVPDLADFWEASPDAMSFVFHLNPQATWHDGRPVTAHDCAFTLDAVLDVRSLGTFRSDVASVVARYRAIDDHKFELRFRRPTADPFEKSIRGLSILPRHVWQPIPLNEWGAAPGATGADPSQVVGSGPFRFGEWARGQHVTVVRNDDFRVLLPANLQPGVRPAERCVSA